MDGDDAARASSSRPDAAPPDHPQHPQQQRQHDSLDPVASAAAMARAVEAAQYGRRGELEELIDSGAVGVDDQDGEGCRLLQWASDTRAVFYMPLQCGARGPPPVVMSTVGSW